MSFIWPWMLVTLLLVPVLIGFYLRLQRRRRQAAAELGPLGVAQSSTGRAVGRKRHIPALLFLLGLAILLVGLARPEAAVSLPRIEGTVILAFDISSSMTADDLEPTRIEAAKAAARAFVENQPSTILIGVVAFSNGGIVIQKPTDDQAAVLATIDRLSPQGGTSLGQGIFSSLNAIAGEPLAIDEETLAALGIEPGLFDERGPANGRPAEEAPLIQLEDYSSAVIVLLTDGENTEPPEPLTVAQLAAEAGVRLYTVGIGSPEGTVVEVDGFSILTQLNETTLQQLASITNGAYFHAEDEESLKQIYEDIDLQLTISGEMIEITAIFAGAGLLLFLAGGLLSLLWFGRVP